jgi:hypothetical protein
MSIIFCILLIVASANSFASHAYETDCEETQIERLIEIFSGSVIPPLDSDGNPVKIPGLIYIIPPAYRGYFIVALVDDPTPECIDFILAYTGIPPERATIVNGRLEFGGLGGYSRDALMFPNTDSGREEMARIMSFPLHESVIYLPRDVPHSTRTAEQSHVILSALALGMLVFTALLF